MNRVCEMMTDVSEDPYLQMRYERDPESVLARYALTPADVRAALLDDAVIDHGVWSACQTCSDPGPDRMPDDEDDTIDQIHMR